MMRIERVLGGKFVFIQEDQAFKCFIGIALLSSRARRRGW